MISPLRNRFGIPGAISVIALVFAMLGGAYAASSDSGSGKATASAKAKKGPRGPRGPKGPAGPQGPAGPAGAKGDTGAAGSNGTNGKDGTNGKSVVTGAATLAECPEVGGSTVEVSGEPATKKKICNGKNGTTGFVKTLPGGESLTGTWGSMAVPVETEPEVFVGEVRSPVTFALPLEAPIPPANTVLVPGGGEGELGKCSDAAETTKGTMANPLAAPGFFCVYSAGLGFTNATFARKPSDLSDGADPYGSIVGVEGGIPGFGYFGTWAVTAP